MHLLFLSLGTKFVPSSCTKNLAPNLCQNRGFTYLFWASHLCLVHVPFVSFLGHLTCV